MESAPFEIEQPDIRIDKAAIRAAKAARAKSEVVSFASLRADIIRGYVRSEHYDDLTSSVDVPLDDAAGNVRVTRAMIEEALGDLIACQYRAAPRVVRMVLFEGATPVQAARECGICADNGRNSMSFFYTRVLELATEAPETLPPIGEEEVTPEIWWIASRPSDDLSALLPVWVRIRVAIYRRTVRREFN